VHYELLGELNLPSLLHFCDVQRLIKHHSLGWEWTKKVIFPACSIAAQRDVYTCVTVLDLKGVKMSSFTKDVRTFVHEVSSIDQVRIRIHLGCRSVGM
jgi:hypothetical protein